MQSLGWYFKRLSTMSGGEILWRMGGKFQDATDGVLLPYRSRSRSIGHYTHCQNIEDVCDRTIFAALEKDNPFGAANCHSWVESLVAHADRIVEGKLDLFDLEDLQVGPEIQWNYDYKARKRSPLPVASRVDYRDYDAVGDCKFVWEPNRHQHWVVLGRAYCFSKDERYAQAIVDQFDSWTRSCPVGRGMNWRSPLELGIRMISWSWAFSLIDDANCMTENVRRRIIESVYHHLSDIARKFSRYSSANNHLIGEAAGVFIASSYFSGLRNADRWRKASRAILEQEILRQAFDDGGTKEQATGYHLFSLEFFALAGLVARHGGQDFGAGYWARMEKMVEFVAGMSEGGAAMPMIGDADDGYVVDLGNRADAATSAIAMGALLFGRADFKRTAGHLRENCFWLFGTDAMKRWDSIQDDGGSSSLLSRAFPDSGYFILQHGDRESPQRMSLMMDSGPLGFLAIAAHGHADALSVVLRVGGVDVLVDPGTYDYFTYPKWREHFRCTRAHNTIEVDGQNQSQMLGAFMWGQRARARCEAWAPNAEGGTLVAEHDGYARLSDPVLHRRSVEMVGHDQRVLIDDDLQMKGHHDVALYWHFAEQCKIVSERENRVEIDYGTGRLVMELDNRLSVSREIANESSMLGWVSRGYHRKTPSLTLVARGSFDQDTKLTTEMQIVTGMEGSSTNGTADSMATVRSTGE